MTLDTLRVGQRGTVIAIEGTDSVAVRLMEMGIIEGEVMELVTKAPLGDPLEFAIRGYRLSLRRAEALRVQIELCQS